MFTKEDYTEYFESIKKKEDDMAGSLDRAISSLSNTMLIDSMKKVLNDETIHVKLARELFVFLEKL